MSEGIKKEDINKSFEVVVKITETGPKNIKSSHYMTEENENIAKSLSYFGELHIVYGLLWESFKRDCFHNLCFKLQKDSNFLKNLISSDELSKKKILAQIKEEVLMSLFNEISLKGDAIIETVALSLKDN